MPTPADRGPGRPWRPGTPPPAPVDPDLPSADIRLGCARCSTLGQELDSQLDALAGHGIPRDKIFSEKTSTRVRVRPRFEEALRTAREVKAHAPHCRVIFTVYEMKRLGRDAAELTALADHLTAHGRPGPGDARRAPARLPSPGKPRACHGRSPAGFVHFQQQHLFVISGGIWRVSASGMFTRIGFWHRSWGALLSVTPVFDCEMVVRVRPRTPCRRATGSDAPSRTCTSLLRVAVGGDGAGHAGRRIVLGLACVRRDRRRGRRGGDCRVRHG
ncbi:recombinase family protein [Streptomyces sp. NBC_01260]